VSACVSLFLIWNRYGLIDPMRGTVCCRTPRRPAICTNRNVHDFQDRRGSVTALAAASLRAASFSEGCLAGSALLVRDLVQGTMVRSHGLRSNTRDKFAKPFRGHGKPLPSKYLTTYKVGEYVDIAADSSIHKGMPHKFYHGRTGRVFDVTPRSIGVEVNKEVNGRILVKRIHVRVEHVRPSRCQEAFKALVRARDAARRAARAAGEPKVIHEKRQPAGPRPARVVQVGAGGIKHLEAKPYEFIC